MFSCSLRCQPSRFGVCAVRVCNRTAIGLLVNSAFLQKIIEPLYRNGPLLFFGAILLGQPPSFLKGSGLILGGLPQLCKRIRKLLRGDIAISQRLSKPRRFSRKRLLSPHSQFAVLGELVEDFAGLFGFLPQPLKRTLNRRQANAAGVARDL